MNLANELIIQHVVELSGGCSCLGAGLELVSANSAMSSAVQGGLHPAACASLLVMALNSVGAGSAGGGMGGCDAVPWCGQSHCGSEQSFSACPACQAAVRLGMTPCCAWRGMGGGTMRICGGGEAALGAGRTARLLWSEL